MRKTITLLTILLLVVFMIGCENSVNPMEPITGQQTGEKAMLAKPGNGVVINVNTGVTYTTIQAAIDVASPGDVINVGPGTYPEYLHITTDFLTIEGSSIGSCIIDLDGLIPYWHYSGCSGSYASRAGVLISGYGNPDQIVEGVTFKGFTVKNAGLNPPGGGSYPEFYDQYGDGQDDVRGLSIGNGKNILIQNCKITNSGYGGITTGYARCVTTHKYSEYITIDNCIIKDHPHGGINIGNNAGSFTVTNNVIENIGQPHYSDPTREYMGYGIQVSGKKNLMTSGLIANNKCINNSFIGINITKYTDGITIENNEVKGNNLDQDGAGIFMYHSNHPELCKNHIVRNNKVEKNIRGIVAYYTSYCIIEGNKIKTDSGVFPVGQEAIKIDGSNNTTVKNNDIIFSDGTGIGVQNTWNDYPSYDNLITRNSIKNTKFAGIRIRSDAYDNVFTYNTIMNTKLLTRWAGEIYEETQGDGVIIDDTAGLNNAFNYNNIYNNDDDGMENQTVDLIDAENNWWGHPTGPDGKGSSVVGNVDYDPWLSHRSK